MQDRAGLPALQLLLFVGCAQEGQSRAIHPDGGLHHRGGEALARLLIHHREVLPRVLRMLREVVAAPVVDAFDLLPSEGKEELDVEGAATVVGQLLRRVGPGAQVALSEAQLAVEGDPLPNPVIEPLGGGVGMAEELHLRLLELARAESEIAGVDLVAEGLTDLSDPEGDLLPGHLAHTAVVREDRAAGLGPQVGHGCGVRLGADPRAQHQVELAGLGQLVVAVLRGAAARRLVQLVCAEALLAGATVHHRVAEVLDVTRGLPGAGVGDDRAVDPHHVVAGAHHPLPPQGFQIVLEFDTQRPIVPETVDAPVDLPGLEDEPTSRTERHDVLHAQRPGGGRRVSGFRAHRAPWEEAGDGEGRILPLG